MVVTVTREGYIKRTALSEYREQKRGGKGTQGMNTKETDVVTNLFVTNTHTPLLFFSSDGFVYKLKTWRLPQSGRNSKGKAIINLLPINSSAELPLFYQLKLRKRHGKIYKYFLQLQQVMLEEMRFQISRM